MLSEMLKRLAHEFGFLNEGESDEKRGELEAQVEKEVLNKLDRSAKLDEVETIAFGLETDDGKIVKVYVNAEQAEAFEKALGDKLGEVDDIEEALNELSKEFEIVDVDWPEEETDGEEEESDETSEDGSAAMNPQVYDKKKDEKNLTPKMEELTFGERATLDLFEADGTTIEGRLTTPAQLMVFHAILELGIPPVALNRNPYRTAILKGIRDVAYQLSKNSAMKQALKMFVKKSTEHEEEKVPDHVHDDKHGHDQGHPHGKQEHDDKHVRESALERGQEFLTEGVSQDFWAAFTTLVKYISPDPASTKSLLDSTKLEQLMARSSGALTSRVSSSVRMRLNDLMKAMVTDTDGQAPAAVVESASVDEVEGLISNLLRLADSSRGGIQAQAILTSTQYQQFMTKVKTKLSQKFNGVVRTKLNSLNTVLTDAVSGVTESTTPPEKLLEEKCKWEIEQTDEGLKLGCGFVQLTLDAENSEKLAKAISTRDAIVVKDVESSKKYVFSPRGLNVQVKAIGGTTSYVLEVKDVEKLVDLASTPVAEPEEKSSAADEKPEAKKDVKEALGALGQASANKPGQKTWSYTTSREFTADCKRLKYTVEPAGNKLTAKNMLGAKVGEFDEQNNTGWLRQK